ncbi:NUDIX hydrolase domain-like protein [Crepidotus variabilis]|uniref:NUDIX hydrolase domain-like protein n=1 Tax=Crepidotus variabilis TaxID=179855 RepID=A0A9P6E700_9AGAR|nr:NUDIX hydrolase domain-like protein [Crepidotus variabilis]
MAVSRYPTQQHLAGDFVISAGCVLFRENSTTSGDGLEICILHHLERDEWLLPKGRKDRGESIEQAAVRETYEETGYACELWPRKMPTRAPLAGVNNVYAPQVVEGLVEPIAVTIRDMRSEGNHKFIFWFIAKIKEDVEKAEGTQMDTENFESVFLDGEATLQKLTFQMDRDIVRKALEIVRSQ